MPDSATAFSVNGVQIDPAERKLKDGERDTRVEPKVMTLLIILAAKSNVLVSREYLMLGIWRDGGGSDQSLTRLVYQLRRAFKLFPSLEGTIKTVSRSGYRMDASLDAESDAESGEKRRRDRSNSESPTRRREYHLSIGVMPLTDHDAAPGNRYLIDGMSRDLTSLLATTAMLHVVPYSSAMALYAEGIPMETIAETIGCRFMLDGSFRRLGTQIRLRFELVDAHDASLAWSGQYDTVLDRFLEVQRDVLQTVSIAISARVRFPVIVPKTSERAFRDDVYRIIQSAETLRYGYGKTAAHEIVRLLDEGLTIDPGNVILQAGLAVQLSQNVVSRWEEDPESARARAYGLIEQALSKGPVGAEVIASAGIVNAMFHRPDDAIGYLRRAVEIDPNRAHARAVLGWQICLRHADAHGLTFIESSEQRAPHHPRFGLWATYRATAHLFMLDYASAATACEQAIARTPNYYQPRLSLAWALAGLGDPEAAAKAIRTAEKFEGKLITGMFIDEMNKWVGNSPHAARCARALDDLRPLATR